jgi:hypothetical protein|tara:strand:+ start:110 stop:403 length:294 start_codon:yes stop_codon:yes gene_type:complete
MAKRDKGFDELSALGYLGLLDDGSEESSKEGSSLDSIGGVAELLMQLSPVLGMVTGKGDGGGVMDTIGGIGIGGKALQKASSGGKSGGLGSLSKMFS